MKHYLLSVYQPDSPEAPPPDALDKLAQNVNALREAMKDADVWVFSGGLHPPSTATVVKTRDGAATHTDGPYLEGQEHIGGFTIIRAADLDAALEWGRKLSAATTLPIEVRPFR
jgi:hypothetical protein